MRYLDLMASKKISWTNWLYSDDETVRSRIQARHLPGRIVRRYQ